jgi:hypothetical protein
MSVKTLPLDFNKIRKAIANEVERATGLQCILLEPETQKADRPCKPYFTMKFTGPAGKQGDDSRQNVRDNLGHPTTIVNIGGQRKVTVSFQSYGNSHEEAYNFMALWQSSLELEGVQADLRASGIAVWLNGSVADLSALLQTGYEGRAQMDVEFGVAANLTEDQGAIETINIQGNIDTGNDVIEVVLVQVP